MCFVEHGVAECTGAGMWRAEGSFTRLGKGGEVTSRMTTLRIHGKAYMYPLLGFK